jgi:hypothetical protein
MNTKLKIKMVGVMYKVCNKIHTATIEGVNSNFDNSEKKILVPETDVTGENQQFKCIDGELHVKVCFGGDCHWTNTGISC